MVDKSKTIKDSTDKELDDILVRLRKENEAQTLIANLKRGASSGYVPYDYSMSISTEAPIDSLYHFGIPGMKWGHRKGSSETIEKTNSSESNNSADYEKKVALKGKRLSEMTNDELRIYTQRAALERQYKELSKTEISPGKKFVNDLLVNTGKQAVNQFVSAHTKRLVDELLKKTMKASS